MAQQAQEQGTEQASALMGGTQGAPGGDQYASLAQKATSGKMTKWDWAALTAMKSMAQMAPMFRRQNYPLPHSVSVGGGRAQTAVNLFPKAQAQGYRPMLARYLMGRG
jgi:hypothetical protein